jgi:FixJ family two-component response regulator
MSGLELQQFLLAKNQLVPIVFITAHDDEQARRSAMLAGAVDFLHKPFEDHVLLQALSRTATQRAGGAKRSGMQTDAGP